MTISASESVDQPIRTDDEILARVDALIGRACRRQFWLLFLDRDDRQVPVLLPIEDYPSTPYGGSAEYIAMRIGEITASTDAARVVIVWERRLGPATTEADRVWARELGAACAAEDVSVRAQVISHRDGVRWFAADDYA
ncbi:MAG: hypothetical protein ABWX82_07615 [Leifsonia sp.]